MFRGNPGRGRGHVPGCRDEWLSEASQEQDGQLRPAQALAKAKQAGHAAGVADAALGRRHSLRVVAACVDTYYTGPPNCPRPGLLCAARARGTGPLAPGGVLLCVRASAVPYVPRTTWCTTGHRRRRPPSTRTRALVAPALLPVARPAPRRRPLRTRASALEKIHRARWAGRQTGRGLGRRRRALPSRRSCLTGHSPLARSTPGGPR